MPFLAPHVVRGAYTVSPQLHQYYLSPAQNARWRWRTGGKELGRKDGGKGMVTQGVWAAVSATSSNARHVPGMEGYRRWKRLQGMYLIKR